MKLKILGEAAAVGLIDVGLEKIFSPTAMNLGRGAMFATGIILNSATDQYAKETETLYVASTPLLIRSILNSLGAISDYQFGWPGVMERNYGGWPTSGPTTKTPAGLNVFR